LAAPVASDSLLAPFDEEEIVRLYWLHSTVVAERHLVPRGEQCQDHQACRRLASALWLRCTGRLSEEPKRVP
jgi:hypothetical protein